MRSNAKQVMAMVQKRLKTITDDAPVILGDAGTKHFVSSFAKQGYGDESTVQKWDKRKKETKKSKGKPILIGTGRLRRAVNGSLKVLSKSKLIWRVYLPYAELLNNGGTKTVHVAAHARYVFRGDTITGKGRGKNNESGIRSVKKKRIKLKAKEHVKGYSFKARYSARPFMKGGYIFKKMLLRKYNQVVKQALSKR